MQYLNGVIYLDFFKAVSVGRDPVDNSLSVVEYKIPEYSYKMQVPILMKGWKSEADKAREGMEKSLTDEDRKIWLSIRENLGSSTASVQEALRKAIPDYAEAQIGNSG